VHRTRVLVVDAHAEVRAALATVVERDPSLRLVGLASDFGGALEHAIREQPDVAIVGFKLHGGGPRLVREMRASCPNTRVVAFSVYEDRSAVFEMLQAGAIAYLVKGADASEIVRAVERATAGESTLSESVTSDVLHELADHLNRSRISEDVRRRRVARVRQATQPTVGFEALSRFNLEPRQGPAVWFADAASVSLERELERAALESALAGFGRLPPDCFMAVNLGPAAALDDDMTTLLATHRPARTVVELTEHAQVSDYDALHAGLLELRAHGLRLAIDDAGAGYASLRHILNLNPDIIKADISLTALVDSDRGSRAMMSALISFASEMGQLVIAEGIERAETLTALKAIGVHYGQGYLLGRPQPLPAVGVRVP
jgi:EAL domain-containing protein (putative c-di-GMP-specific phosphodiesterase class I)/CheY-like chemotaxis protein